MKNVLLAAFVFLSMPLFAHKFYISIANMEYNAENNRIDVSLKVTAHDFERVLAYKFNRPIHIEEVSDSSEVGLFYQAYLKHNFRVLSEGKAASFIYLGKEIDNREDLYFYFSFVDVLNPASLKLVNNLLFSLSDDQQNIVHYKYKNQTKSVTLLPSQNKATIIFE